MCGFVHFNRLSSMDKAVFVAYDIKLTKNFVYYAL